MLQMSLDLYYQISVVCFEDIFVVLWWRQKRFHLEFYVCRIYGLLQLLFVRSGHFDAFSPQF